MRFSLKEWCLENAREHVLAEWDYEKNQFPPEHYAPVSGKKVWWKCHEGHSWESVINSRSKRGSQCPYCSGHKVLAGFNDLATLRKDLLSDWDFESNQDIVSPTEVTIGSNKKVFWKCQTCSHEWQATVHSRVTGAGCPVCARKKGSSSRQFAKPGHSLIERFPELVKEWHPTKNLDISPQTTPAGSDKIIWWQCKEGHEYQMSVYDRTKSRQCPFCSNKRVLTGFNDLATTHPDIASEWNYEQNNSLMPTQVTFGSNKKAWWMCPLGHEWEAVISSRTTNGHGCPICAGNVVLAGFNDLATAHPTLAEQWSPKNELLPSQVSKASGYKAIWICEKSHEYKATVASRTNMHSGCPICAKELQTSFPEKTICYYLQKCFPDLIEGYRPKWIEKSELDMFIPEIHLAVEYDGGPWHKRTDKDLKKDRLCHEHNLHLIRIRDYACVPLENTTSIQIVLKDKSLEELRKSILALYAIINDNWKKVTPPHIDIEQDKSEIYKLMDVTEKRNSLANLYPELAAEWDAEKNGHLTPKMVTPRVGKKVWWKCSFGHTWQATVASRVNQNVGCSYCSGRFAIPGETDLATTHPEIAKEWHPTRNKSLTPLAVKAGTNKKVWWSCPLGHEYEAPPSARTEKLTGCPICSGKQILVGFNDLQTTHPEIAAQWHPSLNTPLTPSEVTPGSSKRVWWKCPHGHEWITSISHRTNGTGCPSCFRSRKGKAP